MSQGFILIDQKEKYLAVDNQQKKFLKPIFLKHGQLNLVKGELLKALANQFSIFD